MATKPLSSPLLIDVWPSITHFVVFPRPRHRTDGQQPAPLSRHLHVFLKRTNTRSPWTWQLICSPKRWKIYTVRQGSAPKPEATHFSRNQMKVLQICETCRACELTWCEQRTPLWRQTAIDFARSSTRIQDEALFGVWFRFNLTDSPTGIDLEMSHGHFLFHHSKFAITISSQSTLNGPCTSHNVEGLTQPMNKSCWDHQLSWSRKWKYTVRKRMDWNSSRQERRVGFYDRFRKSFGS